MKSLKTVGLACVAALALTATLGIASASASQFRGEAYPVKFDGEQNEWGGLVYNLPGSYSGVLFECAKHHFSGSESAASSALTLTPSFDHPEGCYTAAGKTTITPNGCKYVLHSTNEAAPYTGSMDIACEKEGESIEVKFGKCKITIPAQNGLGSIGFTNTGKGRSRAISASFNVSGLKYTGYSGCPAKQVGSFENGSLKGASTIKGSNEAGGYGLGVYLANEQVKEPPLFNYELGTTLVEGPAANATVSVRFASFECSAVTLTGTPEGLSVAQQSLAPSFAGCTLSGGGFTVELNSCQFVLAAAEGAAPGTGGMSLSCPKEKQLTFTPNNWPACHIRIGSQEWPTAVKFENTGSGTTRAVNWQATLSNMVYEQTGCPSGGSGTFSDGSIKATWTLKGFNSGGSQRGVWIE
jgi:hypothetical protein